MTLPDDVRIFIDAHRVGRLATADARGVPHVVPVCYARVNDDLYFVVDDKPKRRGARILKRLANIAENPRIALVIDDYEDDWTQLAYLLLHLDATIVESDDEYERGLAALRRRYPPYRTMPLRRSTHPMIRMSPRRFHFWRACSTPPSSPAGREA